MLDPMAGSGATLVEGIFLRRNTIGIDLDPLALRLCKTKTTWLEPVQVDEAGQKVINIARRWTQIGDPLEHFSDRLDQATQEFMDYWFKTETQRELSALVLSVQEETDVQLRRLFEVLISSIIVTKSGGVSMARDLAHSRPHLVESKSPRSPFKMFEAQLRNAVRSFRETDDIPRGKSAVLAGDARHLPLADESVDLIVTSPPYANAIDYMRAHKFSLAWLGNPIKHLSILRGKYIGAEKLADIADVALPPSTDITVETLEAIDPRKARILDKYFRDMSFAIQEMHRVIRPGRAVIIVVGPSTMRGLPIQTHDHLACIAAEIGFDVVEVVRRPIDRDRRMMPARHYNNGQSLIEQRIHEEFVIGLVKS